jgi:hypothetical protein
LFLGVGASLDIIVDGVEMVDSGELAVAPASENRVRWTTLTYRACYPSTYRYVQVLIIVASDGFDR